MFLCFLQWASNTCIIIKDKILKEFHIDYKIIHANLEHLENTEE